MKEPLEINVDPDLANQDAMTIFINYRVFDFEGNYIGAAGTGLTVNRVNSLIEEYEHRFGRQIFFCDRNGKIILSPTGSDLQNYNSLSEVPGVGKYADALLNKSLDKLIYQRYGDTYFLNSRFVEELDWFLMVEQTEDHLLAPLKETLFLNILLALIITAVVASISIAAINRHQRSLQMRNDELISANQEVERQKQALQKNARELAKVNESLAALNREKDDILGIVAHDLRNPLNGIMGFCEEIRLKLPADNELLHDYLLEIDNGGREMIQLIEDILNVSNLEDNRQPLEIDPCNWNALIKDVCRRFEPVALKKGIKLTLELDPSADIEVQTGVRWMSIILNNLLSNAIKFSPKNSSVRISSLIKDNTCQVHIEDHGPGIKPGEMDKLFQKFVRLTAQPTGGESSTGLGLYIVKKMCARIGAKIEVNSNYGKGTIFIIKHPTDH
jgi:signal transduction histidine kinase